MGADLVLHMLEIPKNKEPNWKAAKAHAMQLSDVEICELAERYPGDDDDDDDEQDDGEQDEDHEAEQKQDGQEDEDENDGDDQDEDSEVTDSKRRLRRALDRVRSCWEGELRNAVRLKGVNSAIMVVGGTSFGDPFSEIDDVDLFIVSGMATAAGFILP